jgi:hypothetical protein
VLVLLLVLRQCATRGTAAARAGRFQRIENAVVDRMPLSGSSNDSSGRSGA